MRARQSIPTSGRGAGKHPRSNLRYRFASLRALATARERTGFRTCCALRAVVLPKREAPAMERSSAPLTDRACRDATCPDVRLAATEAIADHPCSAWLNALAPNSWFRRTQLNAAACRDCVAAANFSVPINANSRLFRAPDESRIQRTGLVRYPITRAEANIISPVFHMKADHSRRGSAARAAKVNGLISTRVHHGIRTGGPCPPVCKRSRASWRSTRDYDLISMLFTTDLTPLTELASWMARSISAWLSVVPLNVTTPSTVLT